MPDTSTPSGGPPNFKQARRQQPAGSRQLVVGNLSVAMKKYPLHFILVGNTLLIGIVFYPIYAYIYFCFNRFTWFV